MSSAFGMEFEHLDLYGLKSISTQPDKKTIAKLNAAKEYLGDKYVLAKPIKRIDRKKGK
jgi:hypothetical protein